MKPTKKRKLTLSKATVARLGSKQQLDIKGGYYETRFAATCYTWDPVCPTLPLPNCKIMP